MAVVIFDDFSGGIDLVASPSEGKLGLCLNATSRGKAIVKRFGVTFRGDAVSAANFIYYSRVPALSSYLFVQEGTALKRYTLGPTMGSATTIKTFSTSENIAGADFVSGAGATAVVVFVHPDDGVFTYDGTTFSARLGSPVAGRACAVWQNKLWVTGDDTSAAVKTRVWWSNPGRADVWTTATDFIDIREIDDEQPRAIGAGSGMDVVGRGGLCVFKPQSTYIIIDSETGEYQTLDAKRGANDPESVTSIGGSVFACNNKGIYQVTDNGLEDIHRAIAPLWDYENPFSDRLTAFTNGKKLYFARAAGGYIFEFILENGAWWIHQLSDDVGTSIYSATSGSSATSGAVSQSPYLLATDFSTVVDMWYDADSQEAVTGPTTTDGVNNEGNAVTMTVQLPVITNNLDPFRVPRAVVRGWGGDTGVSVTPTIYSNYQSTGTARTAFTLGGTTFTEDTETINQLGVHNALQLRLSGAGSTADEFPDLSVPDSLDFQVSPFGITSVRFDVIPLVGPVSSTSGGGGGGGGE